MSGWEGVLDGGWDDAGMCTVHICGGGGSKPDIPYKAHTLQDVMFNQKYQICRVRVVVMATKTSYYATVQYPFLVRT